MSDGGGLSAIVAEQVNDQLDVADLLGDGNLEEQLDAGELGAAVGRQFGASIGREFGASIGREVHRSVSEGLERERSREEIVADVKAATVDATRETIAGLDGRDSLVAVLRSVGDEDGLGSRVADAVSSVAPEGEDEAEGDESTDEGGVGERVTDAVSTVTSEDEAEGGESEGEVEADESTEAAETADEKAEAADEGADGPSTEDLEDLRRETLEDFLEMMSYRDLQSVAKDVGVKANLSREEMTERIVDQVSTDEAT